MPFKIQIIGTQIAYQNLSEVCFIINNLVTPAEQRTPFEVFTALIAANLNWTVITEEHEFEAAETQVWQLADITIRARRALAAQRHIHMEQGTVARGSGPTDHLYWCQTMEQFERAVAEFRDTFGFVPLVVYDDPNGILRLGFEPSTILQS